MADPLTEDTVIREAVRSRYAAAAQRVTSDREQAFCGATSGGSCDCRSR